MLDSLPKWVARFRENTAVDAQSGTAFLDYPSEWVIPDGLGGFAMGSIAGLPMRRYHGLLCASLSPPVCRTMMLNALDEHIHIPQGGNCGLDLDVRLTGFQFRDQDPPIINPYLVEFVQEIDQLIWVFSIATQLGRVQVRKILTIADHQGGCRVEYEIESGLDSDEPIEIQIRPLVSMRDFHELNAPGSIHSDSYVTSSINEPAVEGVRIQRDGISATLSLRAIGLDWESLPSVWRDIVYSHESQRRQDDAEDLFSPGAFSQLIGRNEVKSLSIEATIGSNATVDWNGCSANRQSRVRSSIDHALASARNPTNKPIREAIAQLASAGDAFVVDRAMQSQDSVSKASTSILAGYPWFSDWGRDTMIALPGLLLTTGRFDEADNALHTFAAAIEHGLIPNRFDDAGGTSHYNTVDASLWFVYACFQWEQQSKQTLDPKLIQACDEILGAYIDGTINKIGVDEQDGLVTAGDEDTQLTWMDALRDGVAFTPRHGKAIEINALWINALECRLRMSEKYPREYTQYCARAKESVHNKMTNGPAGGLVDCLSPLKGVAIHQEIRSDELRPNQLFALSLPMVGLSNEHAGKALSAIRDSLLTPVGMRTLDPSHSDYCAHYQGTMTDRDRAYHNGTVWPWLLGPYCEASLRYSGFNANAQRETQALVLGLVGQMNGSSVGQLFEIYDAEPDESGLFAPQGCPAQAWSIAEALRVLVMSCKA